MPLPSRGDGALNLRMNERASLYPERHLRMVETYGFGLFALPRYRETRHGDWRIVRHLPSLADGYLSGPGHERERHVLYHGRVPWMSSGLMEQESHAFHVAAASGVVVVAGLGMAMYAHAVTNKANVERVIVIERSDAVIHLMREAVAWDMWPEKSKLLIMHADALDPGLGRHIDNATEGRRPDYLFADIWARCASPQAPGETAAMVRALRPRAAGWWGQELAFAEWWRGGQREGRANSAEKASGDPAAIQRALDAYFATLGVPVPVSLGYAAYCRDVMAANPPAPKSAAQPRSAVRSFWRRLFGGQRE